MTTRIHQQATAMQTALAWMALATAAMAQRPEPNVPPGWSVYVVHAPWCAPCQQFRRDYCAITPFRSQLESAFAVKSVEWDKPPEQRWARRFGAMSLPSFIVFRNGYHQRTFSGYDGNWRAFLERLDIDIDTPAGDRTSKNSGPTGQEPRRPITPQERALPEISQLQSELRKLRDQLKATQTIPAAPSAAAPAVISPPSQGEPVGAVGRLVGAGGTDGVEGSWGAVAKTLGTAALAVLAPQVVLPTGALGAAITVAQILRRRRHAMQAQQPPRPWTVERPVVVSTDTPPPAAQVVTQNQYVPVERDTHQEAWAWASQEYARKYPGAEGMIQALDHLMGQYVSAKQKA